MTDRTLPPVNKKTSTVSSGRSLWLSLITLGLTLYTLVVGYWVIIGFGLDTKLVTPLDALFAVSSVQLWWFVTRAAGLMAYLLLWFSTVWGLAVASKIFDKVLHGMFAFDFHEFFSLLGIGFLGLHISVLLFDRYLPYSLAQILVPFLSPYRPLWVGVGTIAFYLTLLVTITFYLRERIGMPAFRKIHFFSLVAYLGATLHGIYAGTDSPLPAAQILYFGTFLVFVFLTVYWLVNLAQRKRAPAKASQGKSAVVAVRNSQAGLD